MVGNRVMPSSLRLKLCHAPHILPLDLLLLILWQSILRLLESQIFSTRTPWHLKNHKRMCST